MTNFPYSGLFHVRLQDDKLSQDGVVVSPLGGFTMVYNITNKEEMEPTIQIAISRCSKIDNFERKLGREIATNRLKAFYNMRPGRRTHAHEQFILDIQDIQGTFFTAPNGEFLEESYNLFVKSIQTNNGVNTVREGDFPLNSILVAFYGNMYLNNHFASDDYPLVIMRHGTNFVADFDQEEFLRMFACDFGYEEEMLEE
jgi:hypothetical protein